MSAVRMILSFKILTVPTGMITRFVGASRVRRARLPGSLLNNYPKERRVTERKILLSASMQVIPRAKGTGIIVGGHLARTDLHEKSAFTHRTDLLVHNFDRDRRREARLGNEESSEFLRGVIKRRVFQSPEDRKSVPARLFRPRSYYAKLRAPTRPP